MVDVVTNHMGYLGCGTCVDYSVFTPFNKASYFHQFCLIDYNNATSIKVVSVMSECVFLGQVIDYSSAGKVIILYLCLT